ncbi:hypothetical protein [Streptomyces sp. NPDC056707]|uniref:hypothetical protein n=1 Tax=Streptomyces sp. NPDC056707 TaxID=3345919 RepID=UPI0036AA885F
MELASLIVAVIAAHLSVGSTLAAWRAVRPRPALAGRFIGAWSSTANNGHLPVIFVHFVLTNRSSHPVYPIGAILEVKIMNNWLSTGRLARYQLNEIAGIEMNIRDSNSGRRTFDLNQRHVTALLKSKVEHGAPLVGLLAFHLGDYRMEELTAGSDPMEIAEYKLTVIDIFGKKHMLKASQREIENVPNGHPSLTEVLHELDIAGRRNE